VRVMSALQRSTSGTGRNGSWSAKWLGVAIAMAFVATLAGAPLHAEDVSGCQKRPAQRALNTQWPINIGMLAEQLIVYRCTDYMNDVANAVAEARTWVERRAPEVENAAVVFDIDETSLSNWEAIYHDHFAFFANGPCDLSSPNACGWVEWFLSARAVALPPTLAFFRFVKTLHDKSGANIAVFFITGRHEEPSLRAATELNLRKEGYDEWQGLYLRPVSTLGEFVSKYKTDARREIEKKFTIIANLGDQYSDLIGDPDNDHADKCFKIPDPFYFIPPALPAEGLKCLSH